MFVAPLDRSLEIQFGNIGDTDGGLFLSLGQARVGGSLPLRNNPGAVVFFSGFPRTSTSGTAKQRARARGICARRLGAALAACDLMGDGRQPSNFTQLYPHDGTPVSKPVPAALPAPRPSYALLTMGTVSDKPRTADFGKYLRWKTRRRAPKMRLSCFCGLRKAPTVHNPQHMGVELPPLAGYLIEGGGRPTCLVAAH